jgi:RNA polymerase sigma factor (sigma-70 family)
MGKVAFSPLIQMIRQIIEDRSVRTESDHDLLQRFRKERDAASFHALLRRHGPMVFDVCRGVLGNEADAEDAFQATFLILARNAGSIVKAASLGSWLHSVAYRAALQARTREATRRKCEARAPERQDSTSDDLTWREVRAVLHEELSKLPERYRTALVASFLECKTQEQAAVQLGIATSTLKERLERGKQLLKLRLVRRGLGPAALLVSAAWPAAASSASLPATLVSTTFKAANLIAAGQTTAGVIPAKVAALSEAVGKAMFATNLKKVASLLMVITLTGALTGVAIRAQQAATTPQPTTRSEEPEKPTAAFRFLKGEYRFLSLGFSRDGKSLVTVTRDPDNQPADPGAKNAVRLWDVQSGSVAWTLAEDEIKDRWYTTSAGVVLSPDGTTVAAPAGGKFDGELSLWLILWDVETRMITHKMKHGTEVRALAFSPNGKMVASGTGCGGVEGDFDSVRLWDVKTGRLLRSLKTRDLEADKIAFSPDSKLVAVCHDPVLDHSNWSAEVTLWDGAEGKWSQALPDSNGIEVISFSSDGKTLLGAGPMQNLGAAQTKLVVWEVATRTTIQKSELKTTKERPALAFSPDGKILAVTDERKVALFDVKAAKRVQTLQAGEGLVGPLCFSPDGSTLAAASSDRTIYLWDFGRETKRK